MCPMINWKLLRFSVVVVHWKSSQKHYYTIIINEQFIENGKISVESDSTVIWLKPKEIVFFILESNEMAVRPLIKHHTEVFNMSDWLTSVWNFLAMCCCCFFFCINIKLIWMCGIYDEDDLIAKAFYSLEKWMLQRIKMIIKSPKIDGWK